MSETWPKETIEFLDAWFGEWGQDEALISLCRIQDGSTRAGLVPLVGTLRGVRSAVLSEGITRLVAGSTGVEERWHLYHGVCFLKNRPAGRAGRGRKEDMLSLPGVFLDLDVKAGGFPDEDTAWAFLRAMPVQPTIIATTGSGGIHAYWRTDRLLEAPKEAEYLLTRWWLMAQELAASFGAEIDRLTDATRIMRTPGSARWDTGGRGCRLASTGGPVLAVKQLEDLTRTAWKNEEDRLAETVRSEKERSTASTRELMKWASIDGISASGEVVNWNAVLALSEIEEACDHIYTWAKILTKAGWTHLETDRDGREIWSRPGHPDKRSCAVDWPVRPDVMSLFSDDPGTNLFDLKKRGVSLTRYRVALRLHYNDDQARMIRDLLDAATDGV